MTEERRFGPCRECGGPVTPDDQGFIQRTISGGAMCWACVRRDDLARDEHGVRETLRRHGDHGSDDRAFDRVVAARDAEIERLRAIESAAAEVMRLVGTDHIGTRYDDAIERLRDRLGAGVR